MIARSARTREQWADPRSRIFLLAAQINAAERRRLRALVEENAKLAPFYANRWARWYPWLDPDDLAQAATLGLIRAAEKWDPRRGAFTTCAWIYMRAAVQREVARTRSTIRVPLGVPADKRGPRTCSLDALIADSDDSFGSTVAAADLSLGLDHESLREHVTRVLGTLRPRDALIVEMRFGINGARRPHTLEEIGKHLGVTRERVRQLEARAFESLRFRLRSLADE